VSQRVARSDSRRRPSIARLRNSQRSAQRPSLNWGRPAFLILPWRTGARRSITAQCGRGHRPDSNDGHGFQPSAWSPQVVWKGLAFFGQVYGLIAAPGVSDQSLFMARAHDREVMALPDSPFTNSRSRSNVIATSAILRWSHSTAAARTQSSPACRFCLSGGTTCWARLCRGRDKKKG
jgi:hypothetical protein